MEQVDETVQKQSIDSCVSSIRKLKKAYAGMQQKGSSVTVVARRLQAFQIGLAALQSAWADQPFPYTAEEASEAGALLASLFPSLESMVGKCIPASSQATLLARRIRSLKLAIQALDEHRAV